MLKRPASEPVVIRLRKQTGGIKVFLLRAGNIVAQRIYPEQERMSYALKELSATLDGDKKFIFVHKNHTEPFKNRSIKNVIRNMLGIMTVL